ncbi:MAG TPA: hypothetical protein VEZ16_00235 [Microvirga sp.]|nr:hypothetical protein [Microvirga sp.]
MDTARAIKARVWEREEHDHYVEPEWVSRRLFEEERFVGSVWDPACGFGRIPEAALAAGLHITFSDIVDRGYLSLGVPTVVGDFLTATPAIEADNIVSNPPFNIADQFALHALKLARTKVAMVFPTARLNAAHWLKGTPLYRVWLLTPRPSMPPGHVIAAGGKPGGGKMDYCWLVWLQGYEGQPSVRWMRKNAEVVG